MLRRRRGRHLRDLRRASCDSKAAFEALSRSCTTPGNRNSSRLVGERRGNEPLITIGSVRPRVFQSKSPPRISSSRDKSLKHAGRGHSSSLARDERIALTVAINPSVHQSSFPPTDDSHSDAYDLGSQSNRSFVSEVIRHKAPSAKGTIKFWSSSQLRTFDSNLKMGFVNQDTVAVYSPGLGRRDRLIGLRKAQSLSTLTRRTSQDFPDDRDDRSVTATPNPFSCLQSETARRRQDRNFSRLVATVKSWSDKKRESRAYSFIISFCSFRCVCVPLSTSENDCGQPVPAYFLPLTHQARFLLLDERDLAQMTLCSAPFFEAECCDSPRLIDAETP